MLGDELVGKYYIICRFTAVPAFAIVRTKQSENVIGLSLGLGLVGRTIVCFAFIDVRVDVSKYFYFGYGNPLRREQFTRVRCHGPALVYC